MTHKGKLSNSQDLCGCTHKKNCPHKFREAEERIQGPERNVCSIASERSAVRSFPLPSLSSPRWLSFPFPLAENPSHCEHSRAEETPYGPGYLHEDSGLLLHGHVLRCPFQRGKQGQQRKTFGGLCCTSGPGRC